MSSYLTIRKNGVYLCAYSRSHPFYQALKDYVPNGQWGVCTSSDLTAVISEIDERIKRFQKATDKEREALPYLKSYEDVYEAINSIHSLKEEIEDLNRCNEFCHFLIDCSDEGTYELEEDGEFNYDKPIDAKIEWKIE